LRIGYVSADFRDHPVGRFLLPLLQRHDSRKFEVFCYSNGPHVDAITKSLQRHAHRWRSIIGQNDDEAAEQIRADRIDLLVDLSGHTSGNRLLVFARKPAPVQVNYLGYPGTTGLTAMDYRLTDRFADPPGLTEPLHVEKLQHLPRTNWCFAPPQDSPPLEPPPAIRRGCVTFGSFNNFGKMTGAMFAVWAEILRQVPGSRLLLKAPALRAQGTRQRILGNFAAQGIEANRLDLHDWQPDYASHLALYGEMDIALDTFPYNGTTTTCDALWMGVPVVTLAGQSHVSRVGLSLLSNVRLPETIATTAEEYIRLAVQLAHDPDRLKILRAQLRERLTTSPLMDADGFTRDVEAAYRQIWRIWCETASAKS
jgi:predicted O-linked N-acetylglucosamine transferase (SPINDLY family)